MRLRVLSFNVWAIPWPVGRRVGERMRAIGAALPELGLDVAALQEVWREDARGALIEAGRAAGLVHVWHNPEARSGGGLLVLSRHPIASARFEDFDLGGLPQRITELDYYGGKGFVELALATPAGEIALVDTHLQAGYGPRRDDEYVGHRMGQVLELSERLRAQRRPLIAAGDFNFQDMYEEYAALVGIAGLRDAAAELDRRQDTVVRRNTYRAYRTGSDERIDFLFLRDGAEDSVAAVDVRRVFDAPVAIDGRPASYSDHAGVMGDFEIRAGGAALPPPDPRALATARRLLAEGRERAQSRRRDQRLSGGLGILSSSLAVAALRNRVASRRQFLRVCFAGGAGVAAAASCGALGLSERFAPDELGAYDRALRRLESLSG